MSVERQPETGDAKLAGPLVPDEAALEGLRELLRAQARYPSLFRNNLDSIACSEPTAASSRAIAPR